MSGHGAKSSCILVHICVSARECPVLIVANFLPIERTSADEIWSPARNIMSLTRCGILKWYDSILSTRKIDRLG